MKCISSLLFSIIFVSHSVWANEPAPLPTDEVAWKDVAQRQQKMMHHNGQSLRYDSYSDWTNGYWERVQRIRKDMTEMRYTDRRWAAQEMLWATPWLNKWVRALPAVCDATQTWHDLELFCGKKDNEQTYIADTLKRTQTETGFVALMTLLANPVATPAAAKKRQNVIKELVTNDELRGVVNTECAAQKKYEIVVHRLFQRQNHLEQGVACNMVHDRAYSRWMNKFATTLFGSDSYSRIMDYIILGLDIKMGALCTLYGLHALRTWRSGRHSSNVRGWGLGNDDQWGRQEGAAMVDSVASNTHIWSHRYAWRWFRSPLSHGAIALLAAWTYYYSIRDRIKTFIADQVFRNVLHESLCTLAEAFRSARRTYDSLKHRPIFRNNNELAPLFDFFENEYAQNDELRDLLKMLNTKTFDSSHALVPAHIGRVIRAQQLFAQVRPKCRPLFAALGFLDAYAGCAALYREHQDTPVAFCFPEYVESAAPQLEARGVWHPFVPVSKAVGNDVSMGTDTHRQVIITGPNSAGKSTFLKSMALASLLAQAWGIAPARSLRMTPFTVLETYLNIADDTAQGESLFTAEVLRSGNVLERLDALTEAEHAAVFFDEMYSSTSPNESVACAYSTAEYLVQQSQALSMIATHFPLLTRIPQQFDAAGNYKMVVDFPEDGTPFVCSFKLLPGISHQHVALDILARRGIKSKIVARARQILTEVLAE